MTSKILKIALIGRTNAGKSTLINSIVGEKISIQNKKINTTQVTIMGVKNIKKTQLINSKNFKHIVADQIYALEHLYIKKGGNFMQGFTKIPKWIPTFLNKKFLHY